MLDTITDLPPGMATASRMATLGEPGSPPLGPDEVWTRLSGGGWLDGKTVGSKRSNWLILTIEDERTDHWYRGHYGASPDIPEYGPDGVRQWVFLGDYDLAKPTKPVS